MVGVGKGIISYEKITSITSLDSEPENKYFFEKVFSDLKQKSVSEGYENSKFLYLILKMRNLNDIFIIAFQ